MSDDIVERLREYNPVKGFIDWKDTMDTAADEIERLREELEASQIAIQGWIGMLGKVAAGE